MYREISVDEYRKYFGFGNEYKIEGFLVYGAWDVEKYTKEILNELSNQEIAFSSRKLPSFLSDITELTIGEKNYWVGVCYGSTKLSEYTHLACLFGSKWVLHIGSAGGLFEGLNTLDIVIPDRSVSEDSVSKLYTSQQDNPLLKKYLSDLFTKRNISIKSGLSLSIQAMMGETFSDIQQWNKDGYVCVDMEASTINAVSNFFNVPSASVLYISDNLIKEETVLSQSYEEQKNKRTEVKKKIYSVVVEVIKIPPAFDGERK